MTLQLIPSRTISLLSGKPLPVRRVGIRKAIAAPGIPRRLDWALLKFPEPPKRFCGYNYQGNAHQSTHC
jgi:hypothetical protein